MIVLKEWKVNKNGGLRVHMYKGWFLFGFIPLFIRRYGVYV